MGLEKTTAIIAAWSNLVARRPHKPQVVGSNPTAATNLLQTKNPFMRWEYTASFVNEGQRDLEELNRFGKDGWEAFDIVNKGGVNCIYYKRPSLSQEEKK